MLWAARKLAPAREVDVRAAGGDPGRRARADNVTDAELALDADGRFLGCASTTLANVRAYVLLDRNLLATFSNVVTLVGVYKFPAAYVHVTSVMTNTNSTAPVPGAGRPEATYVLERLIDDTARELGLDPVELAPEDLIPTAAMAVQEIRSARPTTAAISRQQERALKLGEVAGFALPARRVGARQAARAAVVNPIEQAAGAQPEFAEIASRRAAAPPSSWVETRARATRRPSSQILKRALGLDPKDVLYVDGDTDRVAFGMARWLTVDRDRRQRAVDGRRQGDRQGQEDRARLLEAAEADVTFADGKFGVVGTDRAVVLRDVARAGSAGAASAGVEPGLYETGTFSPKQAHVAATAAHVCEVEIDPDTGNVAIVSYVIVDDVGNRDQTR